MSCQKSVNQCPAWSVLTELLCFGFTESSSIQPSRTSYVSSSSASVNRGKTSTDAEKVSNEWQLTRSECNFVNVGLIISRWNVCLFVCLFVFFVFFWGGGSFVSQIPCDNFWYRRKAMFDRLLCAIQNTAAGRHFYKDGRQKIKIHRFRNIFTITDKFLRLRYKAQIKLEYHMI